MKFYPSPALLKAKMRSSGPAWGQAVLFDGEIQITFDINQSDFLEDAANALQEVGLLGKAPKGVGFTHAILNPPYRKINTNSSARKLLRQVGLETSNLYAGFMWLSAQLLSSNGQLVSINPRSFCNGPYFLPFRKKFFSEMELERVHVFNRRDAVFSKDAILQENLILSARRSRTKKSFVALSHSDGTLGSTVRTRNVPCERIIVPSDANQMLHFSLDESDDVVRLRMEEMPALLEELGLRVSTGRVVDFRARSFLRDNPEKGTVPLIYPMHFNGGGVHWPCPDSKKANALVASQETQDLLVANGVYVLVKRFTAKEERKRIVATVFSPKGELVNFDSIGFENHLNYFYARTKPLDDALAWGLAIYLNSTLVDSYFRQFSGHTQVNATDLRNLRYPTLKQLRSLSRSMKTRTFDQSAVDRSVAATL